MLTATLTPSREISMGTLVQRIGTSDPRSCGEVCHDDGENIAVAWSSGGESGLLPRSGFIRIGDLGLKREVALMMMRVNNEGHHCA